LRCDHVSCFFSNSLASINRNRNPELHMLLLSVLPQVLLVLLAALLLTNHL
jgi:hypothetical protein